MAVNNTVQSVGNATVTFTHPLVLGGAAIVMTGFKLDEQFIDTVQALDNSKVIPLVGGRTATLTNTVRAGTLTMNCVRTGASTDLASGDAVALARYLQTVGDSQGGQIRVTFGLNGQTEATTFLATTVKSCPPVKLSGNDLPTYAVVWNYGDYTNV